MEKRETGMVAWFTDANGEGLIERDQGGEAKVHYRSIAGIGYRSLREGQRVEFTIKEKDGEILAEDVIVLS